MTDEAKRWCFRLPAVVRNSVTALSLRATCDCFEHDDLALEMYG
jgi:hypothetical protein